MESSALSGTSSSPPSPQDTPQWQFGGSSRGGSAVMDQGRCLTGAAAGVVHGLGLEEFRVWLRGLAHQLPCPSKPGKFSLWAGCIRRNLKSD